MLLFGGLIAPLAEVKLGIGGTSYLDFIESVHLPRQLAMVDPIVASFTGGAVEAISPRFSSSRSKTLRSRRRSCACTARGAGT